MWTSSEPASAILEGEQESTYFIEELWIDGPGDSADSVICAGLEICNPSLRLSLVVCVLTYYDLFANGPQL